MKNYFKTDGHGSIIGLTDEGKEASEFIIPTEINGETIIRIGINAFNNCKKIISIIIPDSVTTIGSNAFNGCSNLTSVTIPKEVTKVGMYAFNKCSSLQVINYTGSRKQFNSINISDLNDKKIINKLLIYHKPEWLNKFLMDVYDNDEKFVNSLDQKGVINFMNSIHNDAEEIIYLRYDKKYTYKDIGIIYDRSRENIRVKINKIIGSFKSPKNIDKIKGEPIIINIDENSLMRDLPLSARPYNAIMRYLCCKSNKKYPDITVADLLEINKAEFFNIRNLGKKSAKELITVLNSFDIHMSKDIEDELFDKYIPELNIKNIAKLLYTQNTPSERRIITVYDYKSKNKIWQGFAKNLQNSIIAEENFEVVEIRVDNNIKGQEHLADYDKAKIILVREII